MYVCICTALTEKELRETVRETVAKIGHPYVSLQVLPRFGPNCGTCTEERRRIIDDELDVLKEQYNES